jgi:hypothetical protein
MTGNWKPPTDLMPYIASIFCPTALELLMKRNFLCAVLVGLSIQASAQGIGTLSPSTVLLGGLGKQDSVLFCPKGIENIALPHFPAPSYAEAKIVAGRLQIEETAWPTTTADVHSKLPNTSTEIGTATTSIGGSIAAIFGIAKADKSIAIDYIKYRIEPLKENNEVVAYSRVGVGMRITVEIRDTTLNFSGTLQSLAAALSVKRVAGTISAELIGISSPDVGMAMPFTADLSEAAVQRIIEAMAVVKSKMFDDKTVIQPQILSRIVCAK